MAQNVAYIGECSMWACKWILLWFRWVNLCTLYRKTGSVAKTRTKCVLLRCSKFMFYCPWRFPLRLFANVSISLWIKVSEMSKLKLTSVKSFGLFLLLNLMSQIDSNITALSTKYQGTVALVLGWLINKFCGGGARPRFQSSWSNQCRGSKT